MGSQVSELSQVCVQAVDFARQAAEDIADPGTVGEHAGYQHEDNDLVTHHFVCLAKGYPGWLWAVTLAAAGDEPTICEANLVAGETALLAPQWIPWSSRLLGSDLHPGDVIPRVSEDPRLEFGYEATDDAEADQVALWELGLGRHRVLSPVGRDDAATRWQHGEFGPEGEHAIEASAPCRSCGYFMPMAGALRQAFGVCANEWSPADGRVVSLEFGCGAHSETDIDTYVEPLSDPVLDETGYDEL